MVVCPETYPIEDWIMMLPLFSTVADCPLMISWAPSSTVTVIPSGMTRVPSIVRTVPLTRVRLSVTVTICLSVKVVLVRSLPESVAFSEMAEVSTTPLPPISTTVAVWLRMATLPLLIRSPSPEMLP